MLTETWHGVCVSCSCYFVRRLVVGLCSVSIGFAFVRFLRSYASSHPRAHPAAAGEVLESYQSRGVPSGIARGRARWSGGRVHLGSHRDVT